MVKEAKMSEPRGTNQERSESFYTNKDVSPGDEHSTWSWGNHEDGDRVHISANHGGHTATVTNVDVSGTIHVVINE